MVTLRYEDGGAAHYNTLEEALAQASADELGGRKALEVLEGVEETEQTEDRDGTPVIVRVRDESNARKVAGRQEIGRAVSERRKRWERDGQRYGNPGEA